MPIEILVSLWLATVSRAEEMTNRSLFVTSRKGKVENENEESLESVLVCQKSHLSCFFFELVGAKMG
jgi:hypothetical protein